ncbi:HRDC domain-containing protein [Paenibacillus crassostreae]|uniref:Helicase n=1 Tax=Paenibacillus crassostreae TaxID=1763538 RepID=A0A167GTC5_9BACL|nr:HRDC domain-containing protein [Paenibacillus crassostreae]AOZ92075.1 helicase [Paenibacillus crassostreae]OAB77884.1 helicase [Paenibacillus crassostreae]
MQIVFMNRLTKRSGSDEEAVAQIWIGEEEGLWHLGWRDILLDGDLNDSSWYEGVSWDELLFIYRHGLASKLGEGYRPLIQGIFHEDDEIRSRGQTIQKLYCYSELHSDENLYAELCAWRRRRAISERKAPYFIASNKLLRLISAYIPQHVDELMQLPGVGQTKASEYGAEIIEITAKLERKHTYPLNWVYTELDEEIFMAWVYKQKEQKYQQELNQYRIRRTLLTGIVAGKNLEQLEQDCGSPRKEIVEALEELEKEGYDTEQLIQHELREMPKDEQIAVWSAFEELGDNLLKPVLQRVYGGDNDSVAKDNIDLCYERIRMIRIQFRRNQGFRRSVG